MKPYRVGRIDEKERIELTYLCNHQWSLYIPCIDFERLARKNQLESMLKLVNEVLNGSKSKRE